MQKRAEKGLLPMKNKAHNFSAMRTAEKLCAHSRKILYAERKNSLRTAREKGLL
jgi:hypothetical protein